MFAVEKENEPDPLDEVKTFELGRYIGSNEAFWRIFGFPIHQRYPSIQHLTVHLENGQRVYFTEATLAGVLTNPPATTLTSFFQLCQDFGS